MINITIKEAADLMGKSPQFVRIGMQRGILDLGQAMQMNGKRWTYAIEPAKLANRWGMSVDELEKELIKRRTL